MLLIHGKIQGGKTKLVLMYFVNIFCHIDRAVNRWKIGERQLDKIP
jgi:hypothetical protein